MLSLFTELFERVLDLLLSFASLSVKRTIASMLFFFHRAGRVVIPLHIVDGDSAVGPRQPVSATSFAATVPIEKMATVSYETCPTSAPFFGFMGVTAALCFASKCYAKNAGSIALSVPLRVFVRAMALRCCATPSLGFFPWLSSPLT